MRLSRNSNLVINFAEPQRAALVFLLQRLRKVVSSFRNVAP
jgi:hypothetical protein